MALDPQIALGVQVPQPENPIATMTQIENVRALRDQREALAEQRQQQAQALIQKAKDTAAINSALQQSNGDLLGAGDLLTKSGNGTLGQTLYTQAEEHRTKMFAALEAQNKASQAHLDLAGQIASTMGDSPEHYEAGRQMIASMLQGDQTLGPWFNSVAPQNALPDQIPGIVGTITKAVQDGKQRAQEEAADTLAFQKGEYDGPMARRLLAVPPAQRPQVLAAGLQGSPSTAARQGLLQTFGSIIGDDAALQKIAHPETPMTPYQEQELKLRQGELAVIQAREAREAKAAAVGATAPDIQPGTPDFKVAQDLAYGRMTPGFFRTLQAYNRDAGKKAALYAKAAELNPDFNEADFERGFKFISSPRIASQLASLDNVESGVSDLLKASDAATRSGSPLLNRALIPAAGLVLGNKKYTNWQTARTAFADELSGALGYGSATDMSREMGFNMTDANLSPEAFRSGIQDIVIPFVDRKRASLLKQGSVYGTGANNSAVSGTQNTSNVKHFSDADVRVTADGRHLALVDGKPTEVVKSGNGWVVKGG